MEVDLLLLSRDLSPPRPDVWQGVQIQQGVKLNVHRVVGTPQADDANRWATIARARNVGKRLGSASWVMSLDDDVVLGPSCVAHLVEALRRRPCFAALGADSAGEMRGEWTNWDYPAHVGMSATLFRRDRLADLTFRWETGKCECRCCCDDLRRAGFGIGYLSSAQAWYRPSPSLQRMCSSARVEDAAGSARASSLPPQARGGRILSAFDRNHFARFRRQFIPTLRGAGNRELLTVVCYGLQPSERRLLESAGLEIASVPDNGVSPALRRLYQFQKVIERWPEDTPVAFWDAGDVFFQGNLRPLWELVHAEPDRLLAVQEPVAIGKSPAIVPWTERILDPVARRHTFDLLSRNPFINAGFAAGTVRSLMSYLRAGDRLINTTLRGVLWWGGQVAMNYYFHTNPGVWREISDTWNYCINCRNPRTYRARPGARIETRAGTAVNVVHANGMTLAPWARSFIN
jgi:hypothetical protein